VLVIFLSAEGSVALATLFSGCY